MKFFNREKELNQLNNLIQEDLSTHNNFYFVYGQMNNGKTALFNEFLFNHLDKEKYLPMYKSLRLICLGLRTIDNFFASFFDDVESLKYWKTQENIVSFSKTLKVDCAYGEFIIPRKDLEEITKEKSYYNMILKYCKIIKDEFGKIPIIVVDDIDLLADRKGEKYKLKDVFDLFVSLNKLELAKVFVITSNTLFVEEWYFEPSIHPRANLLWIDEFDKEIALKFMDFLAEKKELNLKEDDKEYLYEFVGGNPKVIINVFNTATHLEK